MLRELVFFDDVIDKQIVVSVHPRTRTVLNEIWPKGLMIRRSRVSFHDPFGFFDYIKLQQNARVVLSDSGTLTEESAILGFPALNIRETHERQEGMDEGAVPMVGLNPERIVQGIKLLETRERIIAVPNDYFLYNFSDKIATTVLSYVDYTRRTVYGL